MSQPPINEGASQSRVYDIERGLEQFTPDEVARLEAFEARTGLTVGHLMIINNAFELQQNDKGVVTTESVAEYAGKTADSYQFPEPIRSMYVGGVQQGFEAELAEAKRVTGKQSEVIDPNMYFELHRERILKGDTRYYVAVATGVIGLLLTDFATGIPRNLEPADLVRIWRADGRIAEGETEESLLAEAQSAMDIIFGDKPATPENIVAAHNKHWLQGGAIGEPLDPFMRLQFVNPIFILDKLNEHGGNY